VALATAGNWGFAQKALTPERVDLAGRALLLFACASIRNQEKAHPTDTLSLRESPLRCSRARGDASTRCNILVATKHGGHPCPPSPARAALLGASQGNPVSQKLPMASLLVPSPTCGRGWHAVPGEGTFGKGAHFSDEPSLPAFGGTLSRKRARGTTGWLSPEKPPAKGSEPIAFDLPPLGRGLRGVLFLLTSFARAKEVTPDREGPKPSAHNPR
jgi:hypothetical protein